MHWPIAWAPVLVSRDLEKTRKFWRHFRFEMISPPEYRLADAQRLRRKGIDLCFSLTDINYTEAEYLIYSRGYQILVEDIDEWRALFEQSRMNWKMFYPRLGPMLERSPGVPAFAVVDRDANLVWIIADRPGLDDEAVEPADQ